MVALEITIIIVLILLNGVFALSEIAIISARKVRLQQIADSGERGAAEALKLASSPGVFLATVQIGITLIGVLAGALSGATIAEELAAFLSRWQVLQPYASILSFGLVVVAITYLSLVLGELAPKRLALNAPEAIASRVSWPLSQMARVAAPLVRLLSGSADLLLHVLGMRPNPEPIVSEEEIRGMLAQGAQAGVFETAEQEMITGVFRLADRRVGSLGTPRPEIDWINLDDSEEEIRSTIIETRRDRLLVARGNLDNVIGVVRARDLLAESLAGKPLQILPALVEPLMIPESLSVLKAIELLKHAPLKLALVFDEYGGLQSLLTNSDILGVIAGEATIAGQEKISAVQRPDGSWLLDGRMSVEEIQELLDLDTLPFADRAGYATLGGMVMTYLGRVPSPSDSFHWEGYRFEVMDMDGLRVDKVLAEKSTPTGHESQMNP